MVVSMAKRVDKISILKNVTIYSTYLVIFWAFYRFLFQLPDDVTELFVKPAIWLIPVAILLSKEKESISSIGFTFKNFFPSIYFSLWLGVAFLVEALFANYIKYGGFYFSANIGPSGLLPSLGLSFVTSFSEETAFRGYIFSRLSAIFKNEIAPNLIQAALWTAIHIPIAFFVFDMTPAQGVVYLFVTAIFGIGSAFVFAKTKNIYGSILLHVLWEWPIILFR